LALAVLVIVGFTAQPSRAGGNPPPPPPPGQLGPSTITGVGHGPFGVPAIQPRASLATSASAHFTAADAAAYVKANRPPNTVAGTPDPTIVSIVFVPAKSLTAKYGSLSGTTDTTPICVVTLSGTFIVDMYPMGAKPTPYRQGFMMFDGYTGNLLASSVG
jgi:hypothetical protein